MDNQPDDQNISSQAKVPGQDPLESAKTLTNIIYALQGVGVVFTLGTAMLIAVIINYVKFDDVRNTWLESHFQWQIRTFWFALLWSAIGIVMMLTIIGLILGYLILVADVVWVIYRVIKGWLRLNDGKEVHPAA